MNCEIYKNYQIFMALGNIPKELNDYINDLNSNDLIVNISQNFGVAKIQLASETSTQEEFLVIVDKVREILADLVYSEMEESIEEKLVKECLKKGYKINIAESITGGLVSSKIVSVAGSSAILSEGLVTYTDLSKLRRLHVKVETFDNFGAISLECCNEMLDGLKQKDVAISIATTGCAGPTSDEKGTPIGKVFIGVANKNTKKVEEYFFRGMRNYIREITANYALFNAYKLCIES